MSTSHLDTTLLSSFTKLPMTNSSTGIQTSAPTAEKPKKMRCEHKECRTKLGLLGFDCKCGLKLCGAHRYPDTHDCGYNYRAAGEAQLKKTLVDCKADKLSGDRV
jgi:predicted nucleic acid binding AN1-type Zn finger protein